ncbi:MAG: hypothetical protein ABIA04_08375 [Pseudomonadota bacterium]
MKKSVKEYLSQIGQKGGKKSKRKLSRMDAINMTRIREAKRAYKKYYSQCFWSYDPKLKITLKDVKWVGEQLLKNGGIKVWEIGNKLCQ